MDINPFEASTYFLTNPYADLPDIGIKYRNRRVTYGAGNNQRKRRKYARQTPSSKRWKH